MKLKVNNEEKTFDKDTMVITDLLKACDVEMPEMVSVQLNGEFVNKEEYGKVTVAAGDEVDFLYFMGGGRS